MTSRNSIHDGRVQKKDRKEGRKDGSKSLFGRIRQGKVLGLRRMWSTRTRTKRRRGRRRGRGYEGQQGGEISVRGYRGDGQNMGRSNRIGEERVDVIKHWKER